MLSWSSWRACRRFSRGTFWWEVFLIQSVCSDFPFVGSEAAIIKRRCLSSRLLPPQPPLLSLKCPELLSVDYSRTIPQTCFSYIIFKIKLFFHVMQVEWKSIDTWMSLMSFKHNNRYLNDKHTHTQTHTVNDPSAWHPNSPSWQSASQTGMKTNAHTHTWRVNLYCFQEHTCTHTHFSLFIQHTLPVFVHIGALQSQPAINHTCLHPWRRVVSPFRIRERRDSRRVHSRLWTGPFKEDKEAEQEGSSLREAVC